MQGKNDILNLLDQGKIKEALNLIDLQIEQNREDDELYYLKGNTYRKICNWKGAIENYMEALTINQESPAREALKMTEEILNFYNKDIYCQ